MKKKSTIILLLLVSTFANAQFVISNSTNVSVLKGSQIGIQANGLVISANSQLSIVDGPDGSTAINASISGPIVNNNAFDFSNTVFRLNLIGTAQNITGNFVLADLGLETDGIKTVSGNLTVTNNIFFANGILTPLPAGKIIYTGASDGLVTANESSYIDGIFYNAGSSPKRFPIGSDGVFAPAILDNATGEIGMKVVNSPAGLLIDNVELIGINTDRYWEINAPDITQLNSKIGVSLNGLDAFAGLEGGTTVVEAEAVNASASNLGSSSSSDEFVVSRLNVSAPIVTLGKETRIVLKIHDLVTPFGSAGQNDKLYIENIHRFDFNTVTLLDRWGVQVERWENYSNDTNYDFSRLSPGNYICIVQYGNTDGSSQVEQQMVTVLKTN